MKNILLLLSLLFCSSSLLSSPTIWYVNHSATGANTGLNWEEAFVDMQSAIAVAQYGDHIWVAKGTYHPTPDGNREISFVLNNGVKWYGGFEGGEMSLDERDWELNETILSGEIGNQDSLSDNSLHVVYMEAVDSTTIIDGFVVEKGYANPDPNTSQEGNTKRGAGIFLNADDAAFEIRLIVSNCRIRDNYSKLGGGGALLMLGYMVLASPRFFNVIFENNSGSNSGGFGFQGGGEEGRPEIVSCKFINNTAIGYGGGLNYERKSGTKDLLLEDCLFQGNSVGEQGGGCYLNQQFSFLPVDVVSCTFIDNHAAGGGAALGSGALITGNFIRLDSCRFEGHKNSFGTLTCLASPYSVLEMNRCIFENNGIGGDSYNVTAIAFRGRLAVQNSIFRGNLDSWAFALNTFADQGLDFVNCGFFNNNTIDELFRINHEASSDYQPDGPLRFHNCIFQDNRIPPDQEPLFFLDSGWVEMKHCLINEPSFDSCQQMLNSDPWYGGSGEIFCNEGMLYNIDAQFISPETGDYRLNPCSSLRNMGTNAPWDTLPPPQLDLQGHARIAEEVVDIGPFEVGAVALWSDSIQQVSCPGYDDGIVWLQSENTCDPAQFNMNGSPLSSLPASGLAPGDYVFTVSDNLNRTDTIYLTLEPPVPITATAEVSDATAFAIADGQIWLGPVEGGAPPYTLLWSNGSASDTLSGLFPGIYSLTITDALECPAVFEWEVGFVDGTRDIGGKMSLNYWPNPAENTLWIRFDLNRPEAMQLRISDVSGKLLCEREEFCPAGSHLWKMPLDEFPSGIYFAKLNQSAFRFVKN